MGSRKGVSSKSGALTLGACYVFVFDAREVSGGMPSHPLTVPPDGFITATCYMSKGFSHSQINDMPFRSA